MQPKNNPGELHMTLEKCDQSDEERQNSVFQRLPFLNLPKSEKYFHPYILGEAKDADHPSCWAANQISSSTSDKF